MRPARTRTTKRATHARFLLTAAGTAAGTASVALALTLATAAIPAGAAPAAHQSAARQNAPRPNAARPNAAPGFSGRLYGGTALSPTSAWAVGLGSTGSLILHWNGKTWTNLTPPALTRGGFLLGITATSAKNAWAVGLIGNGPGDGTKATDRTLVLHWNGTTWSRVASPTPAPGGGLGSISASSPTDIWAVGWHGAGPDFSGTSRSLTEHWNGTAWTVVNTPSSKSGIRTELHGVLALSKNNVWAVGGTRLDRQIHAYVIHWDGSQWSRVASPTQSPGASLYGVGGTSPGNAWALGTKDYARTLIQRWNGKSWSGPN
jgi:hypothetical protein